MRDKHQRGRSSAQINQRASATRTAHGVGPPPQFRQRNCKFKYQGPGGGSSLHHFSVRNRPITHPKTTRLCRPWPLDRGAAQSLERDWLIAKGNGVDFTVNNRAGLAEDGLRGRSRRITAWRTVRSVAATAKMISSIGSIDEWREVALMDSANTVLTFSRDAQSNLHSRPKARPSVHHGSDAWRCRDRGDQPNHFGRSTPAKADNPPI